MSKEKFSHRRLIWGASIGAIIGVFIPLAVLFLDSTFIEGKGLPGVLENIFLALSLHDPFCSFFNLGMGEHCGWTFIAFGWPLLIITYGILGAAIGFAFDTFSKK